MSLRIGIVGAGANTRSRHIPGFQQIDGVEVTAVCNRTRASGQKAADEFGIARVFDDWRELVAADEVDAVCVGTWPYLHCDISIATLEAGKHILTEARMAMDLSEARRMQAAAQASDRVAMIVPAPFYLESEPTLLEMIAADTFGDLLEINVNALSGGWDPSAPLHWRQRRELSGQNIMSMGILTCRTASESCRSWRVGRQPSTTSAVSLNTVGEAVSKFTAPRAPSSSKVVRPMWHWQVKMAFASWMWLRTRPGAGRWRRTSSMPSVTARR